MISSRDVEERDLAEKLSQMKDVYLWTRIITHKETIEPNTDLRPLLAKIDYIERLAPSMSRLTIEYVGYMAKLYWQALAYRFSRLPVTGQWWPWLKTRDQTCYVAYCLFLLAVRCYTFPYFAPSLLRLDPVLRYVHSAK